MESSVAVWFKSVFNVIMSGDTFNYLPILSPTSDHLSHGIKQSGPNMVDTNNNNESGDKETVYSASSDPNQSITVTPLSKPVLLSTPDSHNHTTKLSNSSNMIDSKSIPLDGVTKSTQTECKPANFFSSSESTLPNCQTKCDRVLQSDLHDCGRNGTNANPIVPCCDIIEYKNRLCQGLKTSPLSNQFQSGQTIKSSKIIEAIIEVIKSQLNTRFDPYLMEKSRNFPINPFLTVCIQDCTIYGFSNVTKSENDGIIRYLGKNRYSIDCIIEIHDLKCDANYVVKLGQQWFKRITLRNKKFCLQMDRALVYVEILINTETHSVRFARFSPISQQQVRCKTRAFSKMSCSHLFSKVMKRHFEKYFAANVLKLENLARKHLGKSSLLDYDDIVTNTALHKLFTCFPYSTANL